MKSLKILAIAVVLASASTISMAYEIPTKLEYCTSEATVAGELQTNRQYHNISQTKAALMNDDSLKNKSNVLDFIYGQQEHLKKNESDIADMYHHLVSSTIEHSTYREPLGKTNKEKDRIISDLIKKTYKECLITNEGLK